MTCKIFSSLLSVLLCLVCATLLAQDKDPRARLTAAHALYYTPTATGLKSFHCDAAIDWKSMLTRLSGVDIPDDNPALKFLQTVHLSVDDELRGNGSLVWTSERDAPQDKAAAIKQIQDGLKTSVSGFFQTWNVYMNGSMVPIPDSTLAITNAGDGVHLSGTSDGSSFDEDFDKNMLLTEVRVVNPSMKVLATPTYASTPDGLLVSTVTSQVSQPSTAPPAQAIFRIDYLKVETFQIPSRVVFDIKNTGVIEIAFNSCRVSLADWAAKKPPSQ
jgi:hypothetical protein